MDVFDFQKESQSQESDMSSFLGYDFLGLLESQNEELAKEEEEEEQAHIVKFKYSDAKKQKLLAAFKRTYVNDYGKKDPYHIDRENSLAERVKNKIHAIYGNRSIVEYIKAMRDVFKVYQEMYNESPNRLVMDLPDYINLIVSGDVPAPFNHPLIRTNVPPEIIMRYILDEKLDPSDIKRYTSTSNEELATSHFVFDITSAKEDIDTPAEYQVLNTTMQKRILESWLEGKPKTRGLDRNESKLSYILTTIYDQANIPINIGEFSFDEPLSHHSDIISWENIKRSAPKSIRLKDYSRKSLQEKQKGEFIRKVMEYDSRDGKENPGLSYSELFRWMEAQASKRNDHLALHNIQNRINLFAQGVIAVKRDKYGREVYKYRDNNKVRHNSIKDKIREIERRAEVFKDMVDAFYDRLHSPNFKAISDEILYEQEMIEKHGLSYYTEGD